MIWDERIIDEQELIGLCNDQNDPSLAARIAALIEHQKRTWPVLSESYRALAKVETKKLQVQEAEVVIQHNPRRAGSTAARVDRASVEARRCFLCPDSLPDEEKGIAYGEDLILLCNPFPILDRHLSIVHREHIEQKIDDNVEVLLRLARALGPDYFVLYNGPQCGASAPDHLHFQACSRELLPIEAGARMEAGELFTIDGCGRSVVVFRGNSAVAVARRVYRMLDELFVETGKAEPMVNIVCTYDARGWTVYLFPRARHRPACFYAEGEDKMTVSPGAIDMAGVVVVPERAHFDKIGREQIEAIFAEVSIAPDIMRSIIERVCKSFIEEELS